ncbi:hypothetical protein PJ985_04075 [Streptomyces sp. ACA25]|uniref:hypothetical protein n=1 Tax=Streptomyces sp. ACA25 TaxID=3022596 RepID=UPI002307C5BB|nr:hypothetical protein [Streptomyces sp. ACA25]MDB1086743.1 hypothetical protein [Streptomyces sp. ACA25]
MTQLPTAPFAVETADRATSGHLPVPPAAPPLVPQPGTGTAPPRQPAWSQTLARLRAGSRTEPGRLRIIGALLAGLMLLFGGATAWQVADRTAAAGTVIDSSQPLSSDAASIHRSLVDANTTAAAGFLAGSAEPPGVRERYEEDIAQAARLITAAAAHGSGSAESQPEIAALNTHLPLYTGLAETARANDRQGLPLGGAYLRHADRMMQDTMLPAADRLHRSETARYTADHREARAWPWFALLTGALALVALGWAQRRHFLRTHRVFNPGLLAATAATAVLLLWLAGAHGVASSALDRADRTGARSVQALNEAWAGALQARGDENMTLVARGAGTAFAESYQEHMTGIAGPPGAPGGVLAEALALADDEAGREAVREAVRGAETWRDRHAVAMERERAGDYETAVSLVTGDVAASEDGSPAGESTGEAFDLVNDSLAEAVDHEQRQFEEAAERGRTALTGLTVGALLLALLGSAAAVLGIGRRLSEYR